MTADHGPGRSALTGRLERILIASLAVAALTAVSPIGWDRHGPLRWLALPTLGFALVAVVVDGRGWPVPSTQDRMGRIALAAWSALLIWGAVAAAMGADPLHAWIGTPDRRFGWSTWLLCGGLFLVGRRPGPDLGPVLARSVAVGALGLGLHTLAQWGGLIGDEGLGGGFADGRLGGPLGQPAYLGAAAALAAPVAAGLAIDDRSARPWRLLGAAGAVAGTAALLLSQSRAAWVGSAAALLILAAAVVLAHRRRGDPDRPPPSVGSPRTERASVAALGVLALVAVIGVPALRSRLVDAWSEGGVIDGRLAEWRVGLRALTASPLVGHGPEGYRTVFGAHVDEAYVVDWGRDVITDRAHNGLLDTALAFGLPGLVMAAVALGVVMLAAARTMGSGDPPSVGVAVGVVAYGVGQQFLFPLSELDPLFWLLAGWVTARAARAASGADRGRSPATASPVARAGPGLARSIVGGLAVGLAVVTGLAGGADLAADIVVEDAVAEPAAGGDPDRATALRPDSIRYRFLASRLASRRGDLEAALAHIDRGLERSPADPALRGERAALLLELARATEGEAGRSAALDRAIADLRALVDDDPLHPRHLQRLGVALALSGRVAEARTVLESALRLAPDDPAAATNLELVESLIEGSPTEDDG